jgi:hypothetical protein
MVLLACSIPTTPKNKKGHQSLSDDGLGFFALLDWCHHPVGIPDVIMLMMPLIESRMAPLPHAAPGSLVEGIKDK